MPLRSHVGHELLDTGGPRVADDESTFTGWFEADALSEPLMKWRDCLHVNGEHMELGMNGFGRIRASMVRRGG